MEPVGQIEEFRQRLEERLLLPLTRASRGYYLLVGALLLVVAWGVYAYSTQFREGLYVTGMRDRILWGLYIINFVFFIGISHAGTLISAILRVSKAGWRVPITRMAEFITLVALMIGAQFPIIDMGRPDRVQNIFLFGRWQSPVVWDVFAITTYITGSFIYLYLPLIPDLALARDRIGHLVSPLKRMFYQVFSLGWHGTVGQKRYLGIALGIMMILIIPVAVSVHTVVSWVFAMQLREPWNNPMFGAFFVAGAIYSGIGTIVIVMAVLRKAYRLEEYITPQHFINLGYMLAGFSLIMIYFNVLEFVTTGYKLAGEGEMHFNQLFTGALAPYFWFYMLGGMIAPGLIILMPWTRNIAGVVTASVLVDIGMWMERYFIVVGGTRVPLMPYDPPTYAPTWVEWSIQAAAFAGFSLIIAIAIKLVPVIAIWEVAEHYEEEKVVSRREAVAGGYEPEPPPEPVLTSPGFRATGRRRT
ncbi:MAG: NrfD/PsrC family molybdoenzyme membrane anchor subunit [Dehalococcoidia bacterium]|nr:NrfD/PsrC family molybdoenzyme membrane anchor subunit [Dehalococcoidia bacterium]